jgi:3-methyladenine DNA glycosylase AlkD
MKLTAKEARRSLKPLSSHAVAESAARFFKMGPGQYSEGDTFIGINVPTLRRVSRAFRAMPLEEIESLLQSPIHEERHLALLILVLQVGRSEDSQRKAAYDLSMRNTQFINNWDLVDCSAPQVVGGFLMNRSRKPLLKLAKSGSLWERRIAIVSTQHFIRHGDLGETLTISHMLLQDKEDLIHKAAGWMLREVGKHDRSVLEGFLDQHGTAMPRTMLRYAIEHFVPDQRREYLQRRHPSSEERSNARRRVSLRPNS